MAAWFLLFFLIPLILAFHFHKNKKTKKNTRRPPGPRGLPFIGNLHQFDGEKPHEFLSKLSNKYGPLVSLKLGSVPVLVISSAKTAKESLKTHDVIFSGRPRMAGMQKLSYNGLDVAFAPYGEYWREMRKISVLHLFSLKRVQSFRPVIENEVSLLVKKISDLSSSSQVINLSSMIMSLTITIICRIAFGKRYEEDSHEKKRFDEIVHETQALFIGFFVSDYLPSLRWIDKLSGMVARLEKNFNDLDLFYRELIDDHLNPNRPETMMDDILDVLIQLKDDQSSSFHLTWDHIKAMLMNIFIGATDTNAVVIVWAMTALMQYPSTMKKVQAEIRDSVQKKGGLTEEVLRDLTYLDAVLKETLRLYIPAPLLIPRETTESCNIGEYDIEAKTLVFINAWAIARDPEIWEDPEHFIPERFLNSSIDVRGNDFELIPFGAGRRGCPGIYMGLSIVKVTLANLLYSFDWELPYGMKREDIDTDILPGLAKHKKIPLCLVAKKRA